MPNNMLRHVLVAVLILTHGVAVASAAVKLAGVFGDHMVLQREMKTPVWGTAEPAEKVVIELGPYRTEATADASGSWTVRLGPMEAGGPFAMTSKAIASASASNKSEVGWRPRAGASWPASPSPALTRHSSGPTPGLTAIPCWSPATQFLDRLPPVMPGQIIRTPAICATRRACLPRPFARTTGLS